MPAIGPSPRLRRMQWVAIVLVTAAIALNYMDRSTLTIGNVRISQEFGSNATAIGALGSAWALTYGFAQSPCGYLLDRVGPKALVGITMIVWSLFQAAGGIAGNCAQLMPSRIGLGATESKQNFAGFIGGTLSPILTGFIVDVTGSFVVALAIGALITLVGAGIFQFMMNTVIEESELERFATAPA